MELEEELPEPSFGLKRRIRVATPSGVRFVVPARRHLAEVIRPAALYYFLRLEKFCSCERRNGRTCSHRPLQEEVAGLTAFRMGRLRSLRGLSSYSEDENSLPLLWNSVLNGVGAD
jgi:hypothetical protein